MRIKASPIWSDFVNQTGALVGGEEVDVVSTDGGGRKILS
jgi:hypothetical protein